MVISKGMTSGNNMHVTIIVEQRARGRWFERDALGNATQCGKAVACEPPARLLRARHLNHKWTRKPDFHTKAELRFVPVADGGTVVTLEHRERFGADACAHAAKFGCGSPTQRAQFAQYANDHSRVRRIT